MDNNHLRAFSIKFIATLAVLYLILGLGYGMTFTEVLLLTLIVGTLAYLIGDLFILPRSNNMVGTIADFVLAWVVIYLFVANFTPIDNVFTASLFATIGLSLFELFFHRYVQNNVLSDQQRRTNQTVTYQTEFSKELDIEKNRDRNNRNQ